MTMLQNQAPDTLPNVLHDQGVPNTLVGIRLPVAPARLRPSAVVIAATVAGILAVVAVLLRGAT